jgi:thymidine kinase
MEGMAATKTKFKSRAVARPVEAGNSAVCVSCGEPVKFTARVKAMQVIANVYVGGIWNRVEHYHAECYEQAGEPYGTAA